MKGRASPGARGRSALQTAGERTKVLWQTFCGAYRRCAEMRAPQAAAGMAFYAVFALFPLLLFLVAVGSFALEAEEARQQVVALVTRFIPTSHGLVVKNLQQLLALRGPASAVATASLLWSASGFFVSLGHQVNRAWPGARLRSPLWRRLVAVAMASGLAALLTIWIIVTALLRFLMAMGSLPAEVMRPYGALLRVGVSHLVPWLLPLLSLLILYRFVPTKRVGWLQALPGALLATLAWRAATAGFVWYLGSGFSKYHLVYGSLGSVIVLMFWVYLSNLIVLFGAHFSAVASEQTGCHSSVGE